MKDRLLELVTDVIDDMNRRRDEKIPTDDLEGLALYGDSGVFDSMHLVNFLTQLEEAIEDEYDVEISLTSEKAVSQRVSPFSRVGRLIDFAADEIAEVGSGQSALSDA